MPVSGRARRAAAHLPPLLLLLCLALAVTPSSAQAQAAICHATGSPAQPFVAMNLAADDLFDHLDHADDLIPAPAGGCPAVDVPDPAATDDPEEPQGAGPGSTPDVIPTPTAPTVTATATATATATPVQAADGAPEADDGGAVLGQGGRDATTRAGAAAALNRLPLTGSETWLIGLAGFGLLLAGLGLSLQLRADRS